MISYRMHDEFIGYHEPGDSIFYSDLRQSVYIKNLKECLKGNIQKAPNKIVRDFSRYFLGISQKLQTKVYLL